MTISNSISSTEIEMNRFCFYLFHILFFLRESLG